MSEELKQCPFCGGKAKATHGVMGVPFIFIKCGQCGAVVSFDNNECNHAPHKAIEYFNRRMQS